MITQLLAALTAAMLGAPAAAVPEQAGPSVLRQSCRHESVRAVDGDSGYYRTHVYRTDANPRACRHVNVRSVRTLDGRPTCATIRVFVPGWDYEAGRRRVCSKWKVVWAGDWWPGIAPGTPFYLVSDKPILAHLMT